LTSTSGCPTAYPFVAEDLFDCPNEAEENMFSNYMDYTDNPCRTLFTQGQKERMNAAINVLRSEILTSEGCTPPPNILAVNFNVSTSQNICAGTAINFNFTGANATEFDWNFEGGSPANSEEENPMITYDEPGVYTVVLTASNGTDEITVTKTEYITVFPKPVVNITQNTPASSASTNDGSVQVEVIDGLGSYTFTIEPSGQMNATGFFENLSLGDYTVTVDNAIPGCTEEISFTVDIASATNEAARLLGQINISPNPNNGRFLVSLGKAFSENSTLQLLDMTGREVKNILVPANQVYLEMWEVQELPSGLYFLKINRNETVAAKKIIIY